MINYINLEMKQAIGEKQEKINMDNGCDLRSCAECDNFLRNVGYCRKRNGFISKDEVEGKK